MINKITFAELVKSYAENNNLTQKQAEQIIRSLFAFLVDDLEANGKAAITNFGSFELKRVAARTGINPQTGEEIIIPAHNKVGFKPYKALEEHVNSDFAHLEPTIIEEDDTPNPTSESTVTPIAPPFVPFFNKKEDEKSDKTDNISQSESIEESKENSISELKQPSDSSSDFDHVFGGTEDLDADFPESDQDTPNLEDDFVFSTEESNPFDESDEIDNDDVSENEEDTTQSEIKPPFFDLDLPDLGDFDDLHPPKQKEVEIKEQEDDVTPPVEVRTESHDSQTTADNSDSELDVAEKEPNETDTVITSPSENKKEENPVVTWILVVLLIFVVAAGVWYFFFRDSKSPSTNQIKNITENTELPPQEMDEPEPLVEETKAKVNNGANTATNEITETKSVAKPIVSASESSIDGSYLIKKDEWMWTISRKVYGKPGLWPLIFERNRSITDDPDYVIPDLNLVIPQIEGTAFNLSKNDYKRLAKATKFVSDAYANAGNSARASEYLRFVKKYERLSK